MWIDEFLKGVRTVKWLSEQHAENSGGGTQSFPVSFCLNLLSTQAAGNVSQSRRPIVKGQLSDLISNSVGRFASEVRNRY